MEIIKNQENEKLTLILEGRLDTNAAPQLEKEIDASTSGIKELVLDMEKLEYISSAGLRVLLGTQKKMSGRGSLVIKNANADIKEIFEITGFAGILKIE